jgi:hypothetical protein
MTPLAWTLLLAVSPSQVPPPGLACLSQWYPVKPLQQDGAWFGVTTSGGKIPWEGAALRSLDERVENPTLSDVYFQPYNAGPIHPITVPDEDPGRVRVEPLLDAAYGATEKDVKLATVVLVGNKLRVHRDVAPALTRVGERLKPLLEKDPSLRPFLTRLGGGFNYRPIAGTTRKSAHSWGLAVDLNVERSHYWRWEKGGWKNLYPLAIVEAFEAEGFIWGGRWFHFDTMHFEYRPELLAPSCRAGP